MHSTKLSSKGQVIIPKAVREAHGWGEGMEFVVEDTGRGVLLSPKPLFKPTSIDEVVGCAGYDGPIISIEEMNEAQLSEAARRNKRATGQK